MEQRILTSEQEQFIALLAADELHAAYYLSGGTALSAYHLKHRLSDDLDFFTEHPVDTVAIHAFIDHAKSALNATTVRFEKIHDRNMFFFTWKDERELKVEFTHYPFHPLEPSSMRDGIQIDSLRDLAANKLMAMLDRFDPKDFVDLYFLLQQNSLHTIRADAQKKFNVKLEATFVGGELAKVSRIEALPIMLVPITVKELKTFFEEQARSLQSEVIEE